MTPDRIKILNRVPGLTLPDTRPAPDGPPMGALSSPLAPGNRPGPAPTSDLRDLLALACAAWQMAALTAQVARLEHANEVLRERLGTLADNDGTTTGQDGESW